MGKSLNQSLNFLICRWRQLHPYLWDLGKLFNEIIIRDEHSPLLYLVKYTKCSGDARALHLINHLYSTILPSIWELFATLCPFRYTLELQRDINHCLSHHGTVRAGEGDRCVHTYLQWIVIKAETESSAGLRVPRQRSGSLSRGEG